MSNNCLVCALHKSSLTRSILTFCQALNLAISDVMTSSGVPTADETQADALTPEAAELDASDPSSSTVHVSFFNMFEGRTGTSTWSNQGNNGGQRWHDGEILQMQPNSRCTEQSTVKKSIPGRNKRASRQLKAQVCSSSAIVSCRMVYG
jgi:hypothetical protein